jgi:hypothetical protein
MGSWPLVPLFITSCRDEDIEMSPSWQTNLLNHSVIIIGKPVPLTSPEKRSRRRKNKTLNLKIKRVYTSSANQ